MAPSFATYLAYALLIGGVLGDSYSTSFYSASPSFKAILGEDPKVTLLPESDRALFHEGGVYDPSTKSLSVTSDNLDDNSTASGLISYLSVITGDLSSPSSVDVETLNGSTHGIIFPLGGYRYLASSGVIAWIGQGSLTEPGGVWFLNPRPPYNATQILSSYGEYSFNSPNDIAVNPAGEIYFSDPVIGYDSGFRPEPTLPNQVYRFNPATGEIRVVADGFGRSNGVGINADGSVVYIIDTGVQGFNSSIDLTGPRTIYAFDVQRTGSSGGLLGNRRLFAFPEVGAYKGVKTDVQGNVYAGVDEGVTVWNSEGEMLGKVMI